MASLVKKILGHPFVAIQINTGASLAQEGMLLAKVNGAGCTRVRFISAAKLAPVA
jgi:hypothetical protein